MKNLAKREVCLQCVHAEVRALFAEMKCVLHVRNVRLCVKACIYHRCCVLPVTSVQLQLQPVRIDRRSTNSAASLLRYIVDSVC